MDYSTLAQAHIKDIAKSIQEPNMHGSASVLVGAGFSKNAVNLTGTSKMPNWEELTFQMYEQLNEKPVSKIELENWNKKKFQKTSGKNVLRLAQEYENAKGRPHLNSLIERAISDEQYVPSELHRTLLSLEWKDVYTTNYDTLLEKSITDRQYKIIANKSDLYASNSPRIIKLHGCFLRNKNYIITEEDFRTYPYNYAPFVNTVQQSMLETKLCLIGFSGDDPNFLSWLGWLRDNMREACPKIYLFGVFNDMTEPERKTLEQFNIAVVDLSFLSKNHSKALELFLAELKKPLSEMPWIDEYESLLQTLNLRDFEEFNVRQYQDFASKLKNQRETMPNYLVLPTDKTNYMKLICTDRKFRYLLHILENDHADKMKMIYEFIWIANKCYAPIHDEDKQKIDEIISNVKPQPDFEMQWCGLAVKLLSIYRMTGERGKFTRIKEIFDENTETFSDESKADFQIELAKYHLGLLDKASTLEVLNSLPDSISLVNSMKKIFLLTALKEDDKAATLLRVIVAEINNKRMPVAVKASYFGYINLCYRLLYHSLWETYEEMKKENIQFSDEQYFDNKYNTRNIVVTTEDRLMRAVDEARGKELSERKKFNPNSASRTFGTTEKIREKNDSAMKYLLLFDDLCLPVFSDHKQAMKEAVLCLSETKLISSKQWAWSILLRINDDKLINEIFTRIYVFNADIEDINLLHERLFVLYKEKNFDQYQSIVRFEVIIDVIARLSLKLSEEKIIEFLKDFVVFASTVDSNAHFFICESIKASFFTFKYHMSEKILIEIKSELLSFSNNKIDPIVLNDYLEYEAFTDIEKEYIDILSGIRSQDEVRRKAALLRLTRITNFISANDKTNEVCAAIWGESNDLSQNRDLLITFGETLPHPQHIDFQSIYKEYLLKHSSFNLDKNVRGIRFGVRSSKSNEIREFLKVFLRSSRSFCRLDYTVINWSSDEIVTLIERVKAYIVYEKDYINEKDDWDFDVNLPYNIALATYYIANEALFANVASGEFWIAYEEIKRIFSEIEFETLHLDLIQELRNNAELSSDIKCLIEQNIYSGDYKFILTSFEMLMSINLIRENNSIDFIWCINTLKAMFVRIPYLDSLCLNKILRQINVFPARVIFENCLQEALEFIDVSIGILKRKFEAKSYDEDLIEVAFNLAHFIRNIYEYCRKQGIELPYQIVSAINYFKKSELPEIRNIWYDYNEFGKE